MFEFTTQTIFNSVVKRDAQHPKGNLIVTSHVEGEGTESETTVTDMVRIGNLRFTKDIVEKITKKVPSEEHLAKVSFDMNDLGNVGKLDENDTIAGNYRIALYIRLSMNSQDSFYSNDFVYKGKPFYVEFNVKNASETPATIAARIKKIADKYLLFTTQEKILNVTVDGTKIVFEGVNGYQMITKAVLQKYNPNAKTIDCCSTEGDFVDIVTGVPVVWTTSISNGVASITAGNMTIEDGVKRNLTDKVETRIEPGVEAFLDYNWIIHNLRLPTCANTYFWSPTKDEMPVVGGIYTQYIITICKDRDGIAGEAVGQRATSVTNHVLYVLKGQESDLETALTAILPEGKVSFETEADTAMVDPFAGIS